MDNYDDSPDFLLTLPDKSKVYLVEVKYRREINQADVLKIAQDLHTRWHPCKLFLATQKGFYYDSCKNIVDNQGEIALLTENLVNLETQKYYLELLKRFEK